MNKVFAWAALLCITASGCAQTGWLADRCCNGCHVVQSQRAPRPKICRDGCVCTAGGLVDCFGNKGSCDAYCCDDGCCDDACCDDGCCGDGCCGECSKGGLLGGRFNPGERICQNYNCVASGWDDCCRRMVGNVAAGCCGNCANGCGLCSRNCNPHAGGYPEPQMFAPGPPTGQVAYPYYTTRGPRDFLQNNPTRIGPY